MRITRRFRSVGIVIARDNDGRGGDRVQLFIGHAHDVQVCAGDEQFAQLLQCFDEFRGVHSHQRVAMFRFGFDPVVIGFSFADRRHAASLCRANELVVIIFRQTPGGKGTPGDPHQ